MGQVSLFLLLLLLQAPSGAAQQRSEKSIARLEVAVVDSDTGQPILGAQVSLIPGGEPIPNPETVALYLEQLSAPGMHPNRVVLRQLQQPPRTGHSIETDGRGKSEFSNVEAGSYRLIASSEGYKSRQNGQTVLNSQGSALTVSPGDNTSVVLRLDRVGTVRGVIRDSNGQPVAKLPVYLLRPYFFVDVRGFYVEKSTKTDTDGRFTITGMSPGRYRVASGGLAGQQLYKLSYYGGVDEATLATPIEVAFGSPVEEVNLVVTPEKLHRVRGHIELGPAFSSSTAPTLVLRSFAAFERAGMERSEIRAQSISRDGRFEFKNLPDGSYSLGIRISDPVVNGPLYPTTNEDRYFEFEVKGSDIEDLSFRMFDVASIKGRVRNLDGTPLSRAGLDLPASFVSAKGRTLPLQISFAPTEEFQLAGGSWIDMNNGNFSIKGLSGRYRVSLPAYFGAYIAEIRLNGARIPNDIVEIPADVTSEVEILLSKNGGAISGVVVDERSNPLREVVFGLLLQDPLPTQTGFYRFVRTDEDGHLRLEAIPPGNYRIFLWEQVDQLSWFDPDLLQRSQVQSTPVHIDQQSQVSINPRIIRLR